MNLFASLGVLGCVLASGAPITSHNAWVPTYRDEVAVRHLDSYLPQVGSDSVSPYQPYCIGVTNSLEGECALFLGLRYSPLLSPWVFDFGCEFYWYQDSLDPTDFNVGAYDKCAYLRIRPANDYFFDVNGNSVQLFGLGYAPSSSGGYSLIYNYNQYQDFYHEPWLPRNQVVVTGAGASVSVPYDIISTSTGSQLFFGVDSYLQSYDLSNIGFNLIDSTLVENFMSTQAMFQIEAFANEFARSSYRSDFYPFLASVITAFRPVFTDLFLWGEYAGTGEDSPAYQAGYQNGYSDGYDAGASTGAPVEVVNFYDVFAMIVSTPVTFLTTALDTELYSGTPYAFNPAVFVISLLSILMIWRIVVMVIGLKGD